MRRFTYLTCVYLLCVHHAPAQVPSVAQPQVSASARKLGYETAPILQTLENLGTLLEKKGGKENLTPDKQTPVNEPLVQVAQRTKYIQGLINRGHAFASVEPAVYTLNQLAAQGGDPAVLDAVAKVHEATQNTRADVLSRLAKENADRETRLVALVNESLKVAMNAKAATNIDASLAAVNNWKAQELDYLDGPQKNRISILTRFLGDWQSMLTAVQQKKYGEALDYLAAFQRMQLHELGPSLKLSFLKAREKEVRLAYNDSIFEAAEEATKRLFAAKSSTEAQLIAQDLETLRTKINASRVENQTDPRTGSLIGTMVVAGKWGTFVDYLDKQDFAAALINLDSMLNMSLLSEPTKKTLLERRRQLVETGATTIKSTLEQIQRDLPNMTAGRELPNGAFSRQKSFLNAIGGQDALLLRISEAELVLPIWSDLLTAELRGDGHAIQSCLARLGRIKPIEPPLIPPTLLAEKQKAAEKSIKTDTPSREVAPAAPTPSESLCDRILAVKTPEELLALAQTITASGQHSEIEDSSATQTLANELRTLGRFWKQAKQQRDFQRIAEPENTSSLCDEAIQSLRNKISKHAAASALKCPQLTEAPLLDEPLDVALQKLAAEYAAKGEWHQTLAILRYAEQGSNSALPWSEFSTTQGVTSYLAGLNFENAEQWPQAVDSYHEVLRQVMGLNPTKEATERLKALKREHPEAFTNSPYPRQR